MTDRLDLFAIVIVVSLLYFPWQLAEVIALARATPYDKAPDYEAVRAGLIRMRDRPVSESDYGLAGGREG